MNTHLISILKGGIIATAAMTLLMFIAPMMGMPEMPVAKMLAGFMNVPLAIGWLMHFIIGIVLATSYILIFRARFSGSPAVKGMYFSLIPFLMAQLLVMPVMGKGLFSSNTAVPVMMVMGSLIGHLVYGSVLGIVSKTN